MRRIGLKLGRVARRERFADDIGALGGSRRLVLGRTTGGVYAALAI